MIILVSQGTVSNVDLEASLDLLRQEEVTLAAIEYPSLGKLYSETSHLVTLCGAGKPPCNLSFSFNFPLYSHGSNLVLSDDLGVHGKCISRAKIELS